MSALEETKPPTNPTSSHYNLNSSSHYVIEAASTSTIPEMANVVVSDEDEELQMLLDGIRTMMIENGEPVHHQPQGVAQGGNLQPMEEWQRYPGDQANRLMEQQEAQLGASPMQPGSPLVGPGTPTPNSPAYMRHRQALQQLLQILRSPPAPNKQQQILQILKSTPQLMAAFIKHRQSAAGHMQHGTLPTGSSTRVLYNPGNVMHQQPLQHLMDTLRSPVSPEQQQHVIHILKSNPQLMAAFIKQRQAQAQAQQGGGAGVAGASPQQLQHMLSQQQHMLSQQQQMLSQQQHMLSQQQSPPQHQNRMQMHMMLGQDAGQGPAHEPPGQPMTQQQQWYNHQQLLAMQQQQQPFQRWFQDDSGSLYSHVWPASQNQDPDVPPMTPRD